MGRTADPNVTAKLRQFLKTSVKEGRDHFYADAVPGLKLTTVYARLTRAYGIAPTPLRGAGTHRMAWSVQALKSALEQETPKKKQRLRRKSIYRKIQTN